MFTFVKGYFSILVIVLCSILGSSVSVAKVQTSVSSQTQNQQQVTTVNINTASAEDLATSLKGIGLSKAQRIVEYRDKYGPFVEIEQLKEVSGIGQSIIDKNLAILTL